MSIHSVFAGRLGQDPELNETDSGISILRISVATDRWDGRKKERVTQWIKVAFFGSRAEGITRVLRKGSWVTVSGRLYIDEWEGRDGVTRTDLYCDASDIELGPKQEAARPQQRNHHPDEHGNPSDKHDDSGMPF